MNMHLMFEVVRASSDVAPCISVYLGALQTLSAIDYNQSLIRGGEVDSSHWKDKCESWHDVSCCTLHILT